MTLWRSAPQLLNAGHTSHVSAVTISILETMMKHSHFALLAPVCALLTGCDILEETKDLVDPPEAAFIGMEVVKAPTARNAAGWACYEWLDDLYCQAGC